MKKLLSVLFALLFGMSVYAEHIISTSLNPLVFSVHDFQDSKDNKFANAIYRAGVNLEYHYLFDSNFFLGADIGLFYTASSLRVNNNFIVKDSLPTVEFASSLGFRFGHSHLMSIELLPVKFTYDCYSGQADFIQNINNRNVTVSANLNGYSVMYSTELRGNIQFGNKNTKNGFTVGVGFPWLMQMNDFNGLYFYNYSSICNSILSCYFSVGYRFSFLM